MDTVELRAEIMRLSREERRELLLDLCFGIVENEKLALTPDELEVIRHRIEEYRQSSNLVIPREFVRDCLRGRFG